MSYSDEFPQDNNFYKGFVITLLLLLWYLPHNPDTEAPFAIKGAELAGVLKIREMD